MCYPLDSDSKNEIFGGRRLEKPRAENGSSRTRRIKKGGEGETEEREE
jgi:hypothetical protein